MPLKIGDRLGPYEILAPIGAGGMGEVYRALDARLGREIALKVLPQELSRDDSRRARFELEARATSALNHPNIVCIHDIGQENEILYMVSELVDGEPLRKVISRGAVPARKLIDIGKQIAEGLAAAHSAGVIHRDLKPENILIKPDGYVKIIDFGLAKQLYSRSSGDAAPTETLTSPGMLMGTIGYMSPEQIRAQSIDPRTDIFSLGVILYEMVAGKSAFTGASGADVMSAILREDPPDLPGADVPPGLVLIIFRCLEKNPARRFQNAADLAFAIRNLSAISQAPNLGTGRRTRPLVWLAWAATALCIVAGAAYWMSPRQRAAPVAIMPMAQSTSPSSKPASPPILPRQERSAVAESKAPRQAVVRPPVQSKPVETATEDKPVPGLVSQSAEAEPPGSGALPGEVLARAQQLNRDGKYAEALEAFSEAIRLKPDYAAAYVGRGNAYFFLQQFDRAVEDSSQALKIRPGFAQAYDVRGRAFMRQKQFDRALQDYNEAIRLNPDLAVAYVDRGHLYNQQGEYQHAVRDFDEAIRLKIDSANAYEGRALAKRRLGDKAGADADKEHAAQLRK
jgi:serine/threonine protein kinase/Tfp pilus assembly protein PilF